MWQCSTAIVFSIIMFFEVYSNLWMLKNRDEEKRKYGFSLTNQGLAVIIPLKKAMMETVVMPQGCTESREGGNRRVWQKRRSLRSCRSEHCSKSGRFSPVTLRAYMMVYRSNRWLRLFLMLSSFYGRRLFLF